MSKFGKMLGLVAALALVVPTQASAQDGAFSIDLFGGIGVPSGDLSDTNDAGFAGGVGLQYLFSPRFGVRADGLFNSLGAKTEDDVAVGTDLKLWQYDVAFVLNVTDPDATQFMFAVDAGVGLSTFSFDDVNGTSIDSETKFTVPGGVKIGYRVSDQVGVFARGRVHIIFMGDDEDDPDASSTLVNFPLTAGVSFMLGG